MAVVEAETNETDILKDVPMKIQKKCSAYADEKAPHVAINAKAYRHAIYNCTASIPIFFITAGMAWNYTMESCRRVGWNKRSANFWKNKWDESYLKCVKGNM
mmetsp:Transcript_30420/g.37318  ORF Transcript_30420/g.37318 Transcript_30420/m.37318 type:complete len:102 (+) Transcript_30420:41-346(+)